MVFILVSSVSDISALDAHAATSGNSSSARLRRWQSSVCWSFPRSTGEVRRIHLCLRRSAPFSAWQSSRSSTVIHLCLGARGTSRALPRPQRSRTPSRAVLRAIEMAPVRIASSPNLPPHDLRNHGDAGRRLPTHRSGQQVGIAAPIPRARNTRPESITAATIETRYASLTATSASTPRAAGSPRKSFPSTNTWPFGPKEIEEAYAATHSE
jgi:hypothetical protein